MSYRPGHTNTKVHRLVQPLIGWNGVGVFMCHVGFKNLIISLLLKMFKEGLKMKLKFLNFQKFTAGKTLVFKNRRNNIKQTKRLQN